MMKQTLDVTPVAGLNAQAVLLASLHAAKPA